MGKLTYFCQMANSTNIQQTILGKLGIEKLNPMQKKAHQAISSKADVVLLSPTGSGKTVAFLLPIIEGLDNAVEEIQVLILVPSRELAIQIEQVIRKMGAGLKVNAVYGGTSGSRDKMDLKHRPAILIGTPGRVAAHLSRELFSTGFIKTIVLDEFDKSLEIGFEREMVEIIDCLPNIRQRILTSATQKLNIPEFVGLTNPKTIDYSNEGDSQLQLKTIVSPSKNKLDTLVKTICNIGNEPGIIFCNFKDSIQEVSDYLTENNIGHCCFHGGMEQIDRETALIKFRNGTHQILLATDLAARGLDIPELKFIIHYELPNRSQEFTHRNGRTARMNATGSAYILKWENQKLPDFSSNSEITKINDAPIPKQSEWETVYITGGRRDKISKGDVAGLFFKQGNLTKDEFGIIELQQNCTFVAVKAYKVNHLLEQINNTKLKKKNIRVTVI